MNASFERWEDAWHWTGDRLRDGQPLPTDREMLVHDRSVIMCQSGLHGSARVLDALQYAPGSTVCRVAMRVLAEQPDKYVGDRRVILWRLDATEVLRAFARQQALSVAHLWDMPKIVRQYLETDDESIREAAWGAAREAAWGAAREAAWGATRAAAWGAAREAAWEAAWAAARGAARAAAWGAAWEAAWEAAWAAAWEASNTTLTTMLEAEAASQGLLP